MKVRPAFAAVLAGLLCGGLAMFQGLAAAEPEVAPVPATIPSGERAIAEPPSPDASPLAAIAPTGQPVSDATAVQPPAVEPAAAPPATTTHPSTKAQTSASDDDTIVCKKIEVFGSRVRKGQLCRTKKEWRMESESAKDYSKAIQKGSATQPRDVGGG